MKKLVNLLAVIGMLAGMVFGQQTAMAQGLTVDSSGSVLHGRSKKVADAILGKLPDITQYNQVTNLVQLSGITSLHIDGVTTLVAGYGYESWVFDPPSRNDFIGLTNLHTLDLSDISLRSSSRSLVQGSLSASAFRDLSNLRKLILEGGVAWNGGLHFVSEDSVDFMNELFSYLPLLEVQKYTTERVIYSRVPIPKYLTVEWEGNVDSSGSVFHELPRRNTHQILSALAAANPDITHYNQVTNVTQLRDIRELDLNVRVVNARYEVRDGYLYAVRVNQLNRLISKNVFDNLVNLRTLDLRGSKLGSFPAGIFDNLVNLDPENLRQLRSPIVQVSPSPLDPNEPLNRYHERTPDGFRITEGKKVHYSEEVPLSVRIGRMASFLVSLNPHLLGFEDTINLRFYPQDGTAEESRDYETSRSRTISISTHRHWGGVSSENREGLDKRR